MRSIIRPLALAAAITMGSTACHNQTASNIENGALNCAEAQVATLAAVLLPSVTDLLSGANPMWAADLDSLVKAVGAAAICAIEKATTPAPVTAKKAVKAPMSPVVVNGKAYLSRHRYVVKH